MQTEELDRRLVEELNRLIDKRLAEEEYRLKQEEEVMNKLAYPPLLSHLAARCRRLLPLLLLQQQQQQQNYYTRLTASFPGRPG